MDEKQLRIQCLQMAQQAVQYAGYAGSPPPTPAAFLAAAKAFYDWVSEQPKPAA
jgi:hypothetical protein